MSFPIKYKDYIIRPEKLSDAKCLTELNNSLVSEGADINRNMKISVKEQEGKLKRLLKEVRMKQRVILVALKNNLIAGAVSVARNTGKQSHTAVLGISVIKEHRGKGLGRALMNAAMNHSRSVMKGLEMIELGVFKRNVVAKNLYKKMGFRKVAVLPKKLKNNGEYFDEEIMHLWFI